MNEKDKNFIPSRTSPRGGRRACYCKDKNTYSRSCCDGSIWAQGIGTVYLTNPLELTWQNITIWNWESINNKWE